MGSHLKTDRINTHTATRLHKYFVLFSKERIILVSLWNDFIMADVMCETCTCGASGTTKISDFAVGFCSCLSPSGFVFHICHPYFQHILIHIWAKLDATACECCAKLIWMSLKFKKKISMWQFSGLLFPWAHEKAISKVGHFCQNSTNRVPSAWNMLWSNWNRSQHNSH